MYLNTHTYYSLKFGTLSPKELLLEMQQLGVDSFALTDINNTSALLETLRLAQETQVRIIAGVDLRIGAKQIAVVLAKNNNGWLEINNYLSDSNVITKKLAHPLPTFTDCVVIYPFQGAPKSALKPNEFIGVSLDSLSSFCLKKRTFGRHKYVILQTASFRNKRDFNAHRLLRAIANNTLLSKLPKTEEGAISHTFYPLEELRAAFAVDPLLALNTQKLMRQCTIEFTFGNEHGHQNLQSYTGNKGLDFRLMKHLCYQGLSYRFPTVNQEIIDRIDKELAIIQQKEFVAYFLVAWKITKYARSKGYFYVGRGSGANSIVSYLLRITDVDPLELGLYFERFINLFRKSPPDFDIDFSWKERQDVTQYIFNRFKHTALLAAYSTFKHKSVIRELGKVFGLPAQEIDKLQRAPKEADEIGQIILRYSTYIQGFPSHLTVHSAGIIISDKPIHYFTATFIPPKGFATTHFDMHIAEDIAFYKFDILGQRGLAKIKDTLKIIEENHGGKKIDIHNIQKLKADARSNGLLEKGNAIGCFYIESPGMRMLLRKLQVNKYLDLVAASSVIRPGVAQSGMMRAYILRHRSEKARQLAQRTFPELYALLPETYGVMVYQEDVIKVAHYFAGLTLAESDVLRRGMSGKYRSRQEFQQVKKLFFSNCEAKKIPVAQVASVWNQIESFAGYAFAKGHSASYAVESYQCLYLKAYYPIEFMVATINNGGGFYSRQLYLHEAKKHGAVIHLPCINQSELIATVNEKCIYLGFGFIQNLEQQTIQFILSARQVGGVFSSFRDFIQRVPISLEQVILLIRADAFRFTYIPKKELLWDAHLLLTKVKKLAVAATLFYTPPVDFRLPPLYKHALEDAYDEIELLGFPVTKSPFNLVKEVSSRGALAADMGINPGKRLTILGYLVHIKRVHTKEGKDMYFGTFIDIAGEWVDAVIFPPVARRYPFTGRGVYELHGKVTEEFGYFSLEVIWHRRLPDQNAAEVESVRLKTSETKKVLGN